MVSFKEPTSNEIINKLKEVSFFLKFANDPVIMEKIAGMCSRRSFKSGNHIIKEGDYGDELYIVLYGEIEIMKKTMQNETYTVTSLRADTGGINVGELALIDNEQRSASVLAKTDCECLVINRKNFIKFGDENPNIGLEITRALARELSSKLRKTNADVITLFSALVQEIDSDQ